MWKRLKRLWELSKYEVVTEQHINGYGTVATLPRLKTADAVPKGMATIVEMEDTIERDFKSEEE